MSRRCVAWLCALALLLSLIPLAMVARYNHAFYDDFGFSIRTHAAWQSTASAGAVLRAALENTVAIRQTWEGTYATSFIGALQPALFGEGLYGVTTIVLLGGLLLALWFFLREALAKLADRLTAFAAACVLGFLAVQFAPNVAEGFFWWNGGTAYTLLWSITLLTAGMWLRFDRMQGKVRCTLMALALVLLTALAGGGKYSTVLLALLCAVCWTIGTFVRKSSKRWVFVGLTLLLGACLLFSAKAPGNGVRAATLSGGMSAPKAVLEALYFGVALLGSYCTLPMAAGLMVVVALAIPSLRRSKLTFRSPVLATLLMVLLFCSQLAPTLFTGNYLGDGRAMDTYWYGFLVMATLLALYWAGWLLQRLEIQPQSEGVRWTTVAIAAVLLAVGCIAYHPDGTESYGPQNMASGAAMRMLLRGDAARYDAAMDARDAVLNDTTQPDVALAPISTIPKLFMGDALVGNQAEYVCNLYTEYYAKATVRVAETE